MGKKIRKDNVHEDWEIALDQEVKEDDKKRKRKNIGLAILTIILIILVLLTTIILGSQLYKIATRDQYTLNLELSDPDGKIELFRVEYENDSGKITVQGGNADKVIAPGTKVYYAIRLHNKEDVTIDFLMTPFAEFLTKDEVPIEFRIIDAFGNYILGDADSWGSVDDLNKLSHKGSIRAGEVYTYHVTWRWVFETGENGDEYDTGLGNHGGPILPGITVGIETHASANSLPIRANSHIMHLFEGPCCWCCYVVWILLIVTCIMIIWVCRLRRKLNKCEELLEDCEAMLEEYDEYLFEQEYAETDDEDQTEDNEINNNQESTENP